MSPNMLSTSIVKEIGLLLPGSSKSPSFKIGDTSGIPVKRRIYKYV